MIQVHNRFDDRQKANIQLNNQGNHLNFGDSMSSPSPRMGRLDSVAVKTMDAVLRGGLVASFCVQDGLGCILPRFATGLTRNKQETGEINVKFAVEEFLREFLTGPGMFAIPAALLWVSNKYFGKANNVPVDYIKHIGGVFKTNSQEYAGIMDKAAQKKAFYTDIFRNVLNEGCGSDKEAADFAQKLIDVENAKSKGMWKQLRGTVQEGSAEDLMTALDKRFVELRKSASTDVVEDLSSVRMKGFKDGTQFSKFVTHMKSYADDAMEAISKADKGSLAEFVDKFNFSRIASRSMLNTAMTAGVLAFVSVVPFLYKINKHYPGTLGAEKAAEESEKAQSEDNAKDSKIDETKSDPNFKGLPDIGKKILGSESLSNFLKKNEYSGISMSFPALVSIVLSVPIPRLLTARDENDYWDTIFRDIPSIAAILLGVKAVRNVLADTFSRSSGFALASKPTEGMGFYAKTFSNRAFSSDYIANRYSDIDKYKNGIADFVDFIDSQGGDMRKLLAYDSGTNAALAKVHEAWAKQGNATSLDKMNNKEIRQMFQAMQILAKDEIVKITDVFKGSGNKFVERAKSLNSRFDFLATFLLIPACLGFLIPKMNEYLSMRRTKKAEHAKLSANKSNAVEVKKLENTLSNEFKSFSS